ncbi:hypothetical protein T492DRAFT_837606 [Pavlovales sp. CCMP2436]|nr:hypothetical protein T492DRAFT_837606 [Pavlovales sp. CCMP2436]
MDDDESSDDQTKSRVDYCSEENLSGVTCFVLLFIKATQIQMHLRYDTLVDAVHRTYGNTRSDGLQITISIQNWPHQFWVIHKPLSLFLFLGRAWPEVPSVAHKSHCRVVSRKPDPRDVPVSYDTGGVEGEEGPFVGADGPASVVGMNASGGGCCDCRTVWDDDEPCWDLMKSIG